MYAFSDSYGLSNHGVVERVYSEAAEYGICCRIQDLQTVVSNLNKYLKKTKVRSAGLCTTFGKKVPGGFTKDHCWREWELDVGAGTRSILKAEQGRFFYFRINSNRHFHIDPDGDAKEVYFFPERKEFAYIVHLKKDVLYFLRDGQRVYVDSPEDLQKREAFFKGLLDSIGFPLETLHVYEPDEEHLGCLALGTWKNEGDGWKPCTPSKY